MYHCAFILQKTPHIHRIGY